MYELLTHIFTIHEFVIRSILCDYKKNTIVYIKLNVHFNDILRFHPTHPQYVILY